MRQVLKHSLTFAVVIAAVLLLAGGGFWWERASSPKAVPRADKESINEGLYSAIISGDIEAVKFYISQGAELHPDEFSPGSPVLAWEQADSPLALAAIKGRAAIAKLLIEAGAEVNPEYRPKPLHCAVQAANNWLFPDPEAREAVPMLLRMGADVDGANEYGVTALHMAVLNQDRDMVKLLVEHGANLDRRAYSPREMASKMKADVWSDKPDSELRDVSLAEYLKLDELSKRPRPNR